MQRYLAQKPKILVSDRYSALPTPVLTRCWVAPGMNSAPVKVTTNRSWLRLVGRRHDVHFWAPDERAPANLCGRTLRGKYPAGLKESEEWAREILDPVVKDFQASCRLSIQSETAEPGSVMLAGHLLPELTAQQQREGVEHEPLREVFVTRCTKMVQVFDVVEHGRRWYRTLVFCSRDSSALHDRIRTSFNPSLNSFTCGSLSALTGRGVSSTSLVITRNLTVSAGIETYLPARFLLGILPDALLAEYSWWQREDENVIGYQHEAFKKLAKVPSHIDVTLRKSGKPDPSGFCGSGAAGLITRTYSDGSSAHRLINLAHGDQQLASLRQFCCRIDNLSHVLAWSQSSQANSVDLVEFPRLRLSFRVGADGRLFSVDQSGFFVSNHRTPALVELLTGLPNALLLEHANSQAFMVLAPATAKPQRFGDVTWSGTVLLQRNDLQWIENLPSVRHYLYDIHPTGTFLIATSMASTLYLLVSCWMSRQYDKAFSMIGSCVTDIGESIVVVVAACVFCCVLFF